uniref:EAL domain-containing protein n=1 Tax=Altererythrobacter segetis TaxID=1104773 RepID=UPI0014081C7D|nr:EAL domain-containing protein [Altererythrobacter segetis]
MTAQRSNSEWTKTLAPLEEPLSEGEARLRAIFDSLPDCVTIFDEAARLKYVNSRGLELLQASDMNALVGSDYLALSPQDLVEWLEVHQKVLAGESVISTYEITGMAGRRRNIEAHSVPICFPDGSQGNMCIARDITERRAAEDALRSSEERLRLVQDATGLAHFEAGADGVAHCSPSFLRQLGLPDDSPTAMKFVDWIHLVHPQDQERLRAVERNLGESDSAQCEFRINRADTDEVRWISSTLKLECDERGMVRRCIGAHFDITDRKRAEEALRESEARLSAILEAMPDCVKIFDEAARITYINPTGLNLLEAPDLATFETSGHVPVASEYLSQCIDVHSRVIAGETVVWTYEIVGMRGARHHVEAHSVPFVLPDGSKAHMCISRDISERRQAEDTLRRSEQRLRLVQDATGLAEFETGADNKMVASERFYEQLGIPVAEGPVDGKAWASQVHPADIGRLVDKLEEGIAQRSGSFSGEFRIVRADTGEMRWLSSNARTEYAEDGAVVRTIGAHLDITERKRAEEALRASEERLRLVQDATGLAEFETTANGISSYSDRFFEQVGLAPRSSEITFEEWVQSVHPDDRERLQRDVERSLLEQEWFNLEFRIVRQDNGEVRWLSAHCGVQHDEVGNPVRCIGAHLDITDRKRAEEALRESEERFRLAAEAAGFGVWDYDEEHDRREWSDRLHEIFGVSGEALNLAETAKRCLHPADRAQFLAVTDELGSGKIDRLEATYRIIRPADGRERWVTLNAWRKHKTDSQSRRIIMTVRDVTEEKTAEDRIRWSANHDPLTRLANRALFQHDLDLAIRRAKASSRNVGVVLLDLDHFKQINDSLGHDVGDALLKMFGERLRSVVRSRDTVARLGGDEFAVVVPNLRCVDDLRQMARSIEQRMREPFVTGGRMLDCRASMGASIYPAHGTTSREMLKNADVALYAAKAAGRGTVTMFEPQMREAMQRDVSMVQLARNAINDDRVIPYYQPKLNLQSGAFDGFEALLRWRTPNGRIGQPAALEAAFDDLEVAAAISDRMIDRVIADMRRWLDRAVDFKHVAVNASAAEFRRDNFAERVLDRLRSAQIPTHCFQIEVTETVFLGRGAESVHRALALLNAQGVKIALDDFGTGYASLRHLKQFPVDIIKIDRSFVRDMEVDPSDEAIVRAVINLGKSLDIDVVAEGIETDAQAERLVRLGCDLGQGFLFSKAVNSSRVPSLVGRLQNTVTTRGRSATAGGLRLVAGKG